MSMIQLHGYGGDVFVLAESIIAVTPGDDEGSELWLHREHSPLTVDESPATVVGVMERMAEAGGYSS